jgi:hypothetical protein
VVPSAEDEREQTTAPKQLGNARSERPRAADD